MLIGMRYLVCVTVKLLGVGVVRLNHATHTSVMV
jgi:hypothetical protein